MACFIVPAAEAVVVTAIEKAAAHKEAADGQQIQAARQQGKYTWKQKISWLSTMLWGGALLLLLEHMWHGEVVPFPPFLTAMSSAAETAVMLQEMATVGVTMAVLVTAAWGVMVLIADHSEALQRKLSGNHKAL